MRMPIIASHIKRRVLTRPAWVLWMLVLLLTGGSALFAQDAVSSGKWTKKGYEVEGEWRIVEKNGGYVLELTGGFATKKAPDLKLFLSKKSAAELSNRNATEGATLIGNLESARGAQSYRLPANMDPKGFKTLVLHCEKYSKLWAVSPLR